MSLEIGIIVKSLNGRDKDSYFCVLELLGDYVMIANGKTRKLESPKKKKIKHLQITKLKVDLETLKTNKHLKKAIDKLYNF